MGSISFDLAVAAVSTAEDRVTDLAQPFLELFPISGASVSTLGTPLGSETIAATDALAERLDELQFDLGEGPCWDALRTQRPVLEPNLTQRPASSWPAFSKAVQTEGVGALFAFPLLIGSVGLGAVDLYSTAPLTLTPTQKQQASALATIVSRVLLNDALKRTGVADDSDAFSRRVIHQATGMVLAQLGVTADDAYLIIQARAFAEGRSMREVATDLVDRRLRFTNDPTSPVEAP
jgi:GAF domain-containing protein